MVLFFTILLFFFFNDTATTEIYTLSLHDALPISDTRRSTSMRLLSLWISRFRRTLRAARIAFDPAQDDDPGGDDDARSEEHTSELQSRQYLVCRLLLEKKKKKNNTHNTIFLNLHL